MDTKKYKAICFDLDHTLLMPDKSISPRTRESLLYLKNQGIQLIPNTGRAFYSLPESVLDFPGIDFVIVSNGAAIYDLPSQKSIFQLNLKEDFADRLFTYLGQKGEYVTYECFVEGQAYTSRDYYNDPADFGIPGEIEKKYVQSTRKPVPDIKEFIREHAGVMDALDVIVLPAQRDRVLKEINSVFRDIYVTASVPHLIEISHEDSGKHKAMSTLMNTLGIPLDQVIAFGDGDNDSEMLSMAGLGVAVSNASPLCKEAADLIIGESREEAIADFLIEFFNISII